MQKYAKIGEIRAAQRDPSDLGRGSVLWAEVRSDGAWFGRARLSQKAGGESEARSEK